MTGYADKILEDLESSEDGFFQIESKSGSAILRVTKPGSKGKKVEYKDVLARLQLFGVENFKEDQIKQIVRNPDGKEHVIGNWSQGKVEDSKVEVKILDEGMRAEATLFPPKHGGAGLSESLFYSSLNEAGVSFGILEAKITSLVREPDFFLPILIAEGRTPVPPTNEKIELQFRVDNQPQLEEDAYGRVDYRNIGMIQSVEAGEVLATKLSSVPGQPGMTVKGTELPCGEPTAVTWKLGENVELRENQVVAKIPGRPVLDTSGTLRVDEVIQLKQVDYSTGNIDFPGTIIVEEKIADGFSLVVQGSLLVRTSVGKVFLKAKGDILLAGGFMGRGEGFIESESNIVAKFVEQGKLVAGGNITILEAALHSELSAKEKIIISGGRGELIGGTTIAGKEVLCTKLGAKVETKTKVSVGTPPELLEELNHMKKESNEKESLLRKVQLTLQKLQETSLKRDLSPEEKESLLKLRDANDKFSKILESLRQQFDTALGNYEPYKESLVLVEKEIQPGVEISFGMGKTYRATLSPLTGKHIIQLGPDGAILVEKQFLKDKV